eukprot:3924509-Prymnesium_polylepis.1
MARCFPLPLQATCACSCPLFDTTPSTAARAASGSFCPTAPVIAPPDLPVYASGESGKCCGLCRQRVQSAAALGAALTLVRPVQAGPAAARERAKCTGDGVLLDEGRLHCRTIGSDRPVPLLGTRSRARMVQELCVWLVLRVRSVSAVPVGPVTRDQSRCQRRLRYPVSWTLERLGRAGLHSPQAQRGARPRGWRQTEPGAAGPDHKPGRQTAR